MILSIGSIPYRRILFKLQQIFTMRIFTVVFCFFIVCSCARQGSPSGGPKDTTPPKFLSSNPDTLSLEVPLDLTSIKMEFDEYVTLKDHTKNIVISPPFETTPIFLPVGTASKTVRIKLNEPLKPNTTYNINFGNALQDNNEGNKLPFFHFVFSTGSYIDSLSLSGKATVPTLRKQSENLLVALYKIDSTYNDSLVLTKKPFYISKVDTANSFRLDYLREGKYQLVAFDDEIQNSQFDIGKEKFGFLTEPIELHGEETANIELFDQLPPYKVGIAEQKEYGHILFRLSGQPDDIQLEPLDFTFTSAHTSYVPKSDSLNFWFNPSIDSIAENSKRLSFLVRNQTKTDTVTVVYSNNKKHALKLTRKSKLDYAPGRNVNFIANYPIKNLDSAYVSVMRDSVQIAVKLIEDSENENGFSLDFPIELNSDYKIALLPNAVFDYFGKTNDTIQFDIRTKSKNDYGNLRLTLQNKPAQPFWLQLLNDKDEILEELYTTASNFDFTFLPTGNYYFKLLVDENENKHWDTGDFFKKIMPEKSYLYPTMINVRLMWDMDETWVLPLTITADTLDTSSTEEGPP